MQPHPDDPRAVRLQLLFRHILERGLLHPLLHLAAHHLREAA